MTTSYEAEAAGVGADDEARVQATSAMMRMKGLMDANMPRVSSRRNAAELPCRTMADTLAGRHR
jgi:hypothetical protein